MRHLQIIIILTILTIHLACKDTNSPPSQETPAVSTTDSSSSSTVVPPAEVLLYVWVDKLRLRKKPDTKSKVVAELKEGAILNYLHEKTAFTIQVSLRDKVYDEPWLKVRTAEGQTGWVFGGGLKTNKPAIDVLPTPYDKCFEELMDDWKYDRFEACAERIRRKQLKKNQQYVSENADGITFKLLSGERKELKNKPESAEKAYVNYKYRYYIPQMGFFVTQVQYYEEGGFLLVNDKSGREILIWGFPKPSPDYRHLLVINSGAIDVYQTNKLQLWGFTESKGFQSLWEEEVRGYLPGPGYWLDTNTAEIEFRPADQNSALPPKIMQLIKNELGSWTLKEKAAE